LLYKQGGNLHGFFRNTTFAFLAALFGLVAFQCDVIAQRHNFHVYDPDEGLSQSQVTAVCQDKEGYLWIGTKGGGLNRFDGKTFEVFQEEDGLADNYIWRLLTDSKGNVWIGTANGLNKYNGNGFETFTTKNGLSGNEIWALAEGADGSIWIGTRENGVDIYNGNSFKNYTTNDGLGFNVVNAVFEDSKGNTWIGSHGYGLASFDGEAFTSINEKYGFKRNFITAITEDQEGNIWIGTEQGVHIYNGTDVLPIRHDQLSSLSVEAMISDKDGAIWVGTYDNGVFRYKDGEVDVYSEENGLSGSYINALFQDSNDHIWIGTDGGGVCRYDGAMFVHTTKNDGLKNNVVKAILKDSRGYMWYGTDKGVTRSDGVNYVTYTMEEGLTNDNIHAIFEDHDHNIWIGTDEGASRLDTTGTFTRFSDKETFTEYGVSCFYQGENSDLLIGTSEGVFQFRNDTFTLRFQDSIIEGGLSTIYKDNDGEIWFCTAYGASRYDGETFRNYRVRDEDDGIAVSGIWQDGRGRHWMATSKGISILSPDGSFESITTSDGLSSNYLHFLVYDDSTLWLGSERGLDRLILNEDFEVQAIRHYGRSEGFRGVECNESAVLKDDEGYLWFGTIKGATRYNSKFDKINTKPPKLKLTGLRLIYQKVDWREHSENSAAYSNVPKNLVVDYSDNHLTFDFIAIDFKNPEKVKYKFKLEGFDAGWSPETKLNFATYTYLPPGKYTFKVKAMNSDGIWSEPISYTFEISAPFWLETWFYATVIPLFLLILYIVIIWRTKQLARSKRKLEETVRLRTREINEQKKELQKLSMAASKMTDGVVIANKNGKVEWLNDSFIRMSGYTKEAFEENYKDFETLGDYSTNPDMSNIIRQFNDGKQDPASFDSQHDTENGDAMWTRGMLTPIYDNKGTLDKIIAVYTDITERKGIEKAIAQSNKDITDSIKYAKQIQEAILPSKRILFGHFPDSFVFYKPRDIVSGDFYWFSKVGDVLVMAAADCTGHGVPGAFMSMIGNEFLHQIVNNSYITGPDQALKNLDQKINRALHQGEGDKGSKDGMDIALCAIHLKTHFCQFAGAFNPLYHIRDGELIEYEATKESIGGYKEEEKSFIAHEFTLQKGDTVYLFSDGFIDQFGGKRNKKYMRRRFKELLLGMQDLDMIAQREKLEEEHTKWRGDNKQVDDMLIIGLRIK
jgi:PAS domain S-box-containing protein